MENELTKTNTNATVRKIRKQFNKINYTLAQIVQDESDMNKRKTELTAKKKELTKTIDEELKEIKVSINRFSEERIFTLGERNARYQDLKQLGLDAQEQDNIASVIDIKTYNQKALQN